MKNEEFAAAGIKMKNKETMSLRPCGFPFVSSFVLLRSCGFPSCGFTLLRSCGFTIRTHLYIIITHKIGLTLRADYKSARTKGGGRRLLLLLTTLLPYYLLLLLPLLLTTFTPYYLLPLLLPPVICPLTSLPSIDFFNFNKIFFNFNKIFLKKITSVPTHLYCMSFQPYSQCHRADCRKSLFLCGVPVRLCLWQTV